MQLFSRNPWSPGAYTNWTIAKCCISTCILLELWKKFKEIKDSMEL
ncbi:hypothetical protein HanRHA438_Chr15g0705191 [Helianthus annuus]|uniref:Uncharacterized protein n=1 Tax=Helianthus annuus TaxID=4232 RepID=A0A9K3E1I9_HELAN|nr:hypothetical protein HanXRQr2_Chr15g0692881 [Helianthus annuus]KAJ0455593.1 hypothetical protein HanIR_Chr15g0752941 [Helianthus annuus]KAJ0831239.1 hypothetical protein HanPSC8_Chr15g0664781 [Helianthus annuus]KAJ0844682.1 hypothetical protein HanRHA438_Chr15g0705191 [Helianthus annuus]